MRAREVARSDQEFGHEKKGTACGVARVRLESVLQDESRRACPELVETGTAEFRAIQISGLTCFLTM